MMTLFEKFPLPWRIVQDETVDPSMCGGGYEIFAANGDCVMNGGTYSGDGDLELNMNRLQAAQLVDAVNKG